MHRVLFRKKEVLVLDLTEYNHVIHEFEPIFDQRSEILILGTLPSVKSREEQFYYGHKQNRFWKVLAGIVGSNIPIDIEEKKAFLLENHIAIWDVIAECDIIGSSDSSIRNVVPTDIKGLLEQTNIERIYANGATAYRLYMKYSFPLTNREIIKLPSTSPANAAYSLDKLMKIWKTSLSWDKSNTMNKNTGCYE